jgi:small subunit ribosomal protein S4
MITHLWSLVNGHVVDIPSYRRKPRDIITIKDDKKSFDLIQKFIVSSAQNKLPKYLTI